MKSDFINNSGYYDETVAKVIKNENRKEKIIKRNKRRNKEVHDTIKEIKDLLAERELELDKRIEIKDLLTLEVYR